MMASHGVRLPAPALRPFVSHYAGFRVHGVPPGTHAGLPSRHAHLIISLAEPIEVLQMPNSTQHPDRFEALVTGLQDAPATVRRGTGLELVHVFLRPAGIRAVLGVSATDVASRVCALSDLWGTASTRVVERLAEATSWPARFAILDEVFLRALIHADRRPAVVWAWTQLASAHGRGSIDGLARYIGWSRQHFTECFRAEFGLAPKTAARIFRFERACHLVKHERTPLADLAVACGYHDQAHMTREWKALAGCSPRAWMASELPFLQDYELAGGEDSEP